MMMSAMMSAMITIHNDNATTLSQKAELFFTEKLGFTPDFQGCWKDLFTSVHKSDIFKKILYFV